MKLAYSVFIRLSLSIVVVLAIWAVGFYTAMMDEVTDEVDDSLEDYTELIIIRSLAGDTLPSADSGTNNQYFIKEVSREYAMQRPALTYKDSMVFLVAKKETEPARILTTIFGDGNGKYYQLEVSVPTIEKADLRQSIFYLIMALFVALLLAFLLINAFVFRRTMKPFYKIVEWLERNRLGSGSEGPQIETCTQEFCKLNEALGKYARHSEELFRQQKQFIGNASHEIQTPIAICRNRIEMLMEDDTLSEKQMEELMKTLNTLEYVSRLNRSLLLLSKIENNQFCDVQDVDFNSVIKGIISDYSEVYEYKGITVSYEEKGVFKAKMDPTLGGILAVNLLKNAFVHSPDKGKLEIRMHHTHMEFRNSAEGGALDGEHIFERFYQVKKKEESSGLGLAIADAICHSAGLKIEYLWKEGFHIFRVRK